METGRQDQANAMWVGTTLIARHGKDLRALRRYATIVRDQVAQRNVLSEMDRLHRPEKLEE